MFCDPVILECIVISEVLRLISLHIDDAFSGFGIGFHWLIDEHRTMICTLGCR